MAIAKNFRRYADAMLCQLDLAFTAGRNRVAEVLRAAARRMPGMLDARRWVVPVRRLPRARLTLPAWLQLTLPEVEAAT